MHPSVGSSRYQKECYRTDSHPWPYLPSPMSPPPGAHKARPLERKVLLPKRFRTVWTVSRLLPKWDRTRRQQLTSLRMV
jgi:hypothetical protein